MPQLTPFRGLRYASVPLNDLSDVICPPYDVISADERSRLAERNPANAVRLELPESYDDAAQLFAAWQRDGTLRRDEQRLIYVYEQRYSVDGEPRRSRGFFCRLSLRGGEDGTGVRPHERTMSAPKEDRLRLLTAVRANLSPVVLLWQAPAGSHITALFDRLTAPPPAIHAVDDGGVEHRLWTADPATDRAATELLAAASSVPLTIADGHHRYEVARRYCMQIGGPGADEVMVLLYEASTGGLSVLPTHRLVRGVAGDLLGRARAAFHAEPALTASGATPDTTGTIGVWTRHGAALLHPSATADALDVKFLNDALPRLVDATTDELTAAARIDYTHSATEAIAAVDGGQADAAFLLAPTPISTVLRVAAAGETMPPKSTYFFPKAATGLVFNPLAS